MNKARRHELKMLHFKRRIKNLGLNDDKLFAYRSHGKPCSCSFCRDEKFNRAKLKQNDLRTAHRSNTI